jgi:hypothetical protein
MFTGGHRTGSCEKRHCGEMRADMKGDSSLLNISSRLGFIACWMLTTVIVYTVLTGGELNVVMNQVFRVGSSTVSPVVIGSAIA